MKTNARRRQIYLQLVVVLQGRGPKSRKEEGSHRLSTSNAEQLSWGEGI